MILAGDVGGTKTNIGLFAPHLDEFSCVRQATYRSREHAGLGPILDDFLAGESVAGACVGIAGPVLDNRCRTPNLSWDVDGNELARRLGLPWLVLINDLVANADGIPVLEPEDFAVLNEADAVEGATQVLVSPGTGLGMSIIPRTSVRSRPLPSEGGHQSFAPRTDLEARLAARLRGRFGHVSVERVVSGPGLGNIFSFLVAKEGIEPDPEVARQVETGDPGRAIGEAGVAGTCPAAVAALDLFLEAYGAAAGNLALTCLARGGVYLGGGIAPRLLPRLADATFMRGFTGKGRFTDLLSRIPVKVILNPKTALFGAARRGHLLSRKD
jgi:glucokinase